MDFILIAEWSAHAKSPAFARQRFSGADILPLIAEAVLAASCAILVAKAKKSRSQGGMYQGSELTDEEVQFGRAMHEYKVDHGRPNPTCSEVLAVLKSMGYKRS